MKHFFVFLLMAFVGQVAFAQAPDRAAANLYANPVSGPRKFELERFAEHLSRLRAAFAGKNASDLAVHESALLTTMRQAMEERTMKPLALPTAARDLEKMQGIFMTFIGYTSFDAAKPAEVATKFALLDDFQQLLQNQYDALK